VQSPDGQAIVLIVCEDITQRKQAEEELRTSRERLRALSANLYSLQEKERTAIARDVHDDFGQVLTSLKMDLILLERKIKTATATELPSLVAAIAPMKATINATIDKLTSLITELRPMVFANLLAALEWQTEEFQKRSGLAVEFTAGVDEIPLAQEHATAVFRIIQESLTNIARHAQARQVQVDIYEEPPNIFVEIIDDGVGVAPEKLAATEAFGVLGMRERALIFGGEVEIISAPGKGTAVKIRIPQGNNHDQNSDC
jgi:signal transduction histidine kinase